MVGMETLNSVYLPSFALPSNKLTVEGCDLGAPTIVTVVGIGTPCLVSNPSPNVKPPKSKARPFLTDTAITNGGYGDVKFSVPVKNWNSDLSVNGFVMMYPNGNGYSNNLDPYSTQNI